MKHLKLWENFSEAKSDNELNDWILTIYNDEEEIVHQESIDNRTEYEAQREAENFVNGYTEYDDGWDWTLMPKSFWDDK